MTAEALLCRQYLGWEHKDQRLLEGVTWLVGNPSISATTTFTTGTTPPRLPITWRANCGSSGTGIMREEVPAQQIRAGEEAGSWNPDGDRWERYGGRLYTTCLCTYMLEVYYRHLPIYAQVGATSEEE